MTPMGPMARRAKAARAAGMGWAVGRYPCSRYRDRGAGRASAALGSTPTSSPSSTSLDNKTKEIQEAAKAAVNTYTCNYPSRPATHGGAPPAVGRSWRPLTSSLGPPSQGDYVPDFHIADMGLSWRTGSPRSRSTCVVLHGKREPNAAPDLARRQWGACQRRPTALGVSFSVSSLSQLCNCLRQYDGMERMQRCQQMVQFDGLAELMQKRRKESPAAPARPNSNTSIV